jgi:polar amino acid transport system permease protein
VIFDPGYAERILPALLSATVITIEITVLGMLIALLVGLPVAAARTLGGISGRLAAAWVEFVRCTPLLVQLYIMFYVLPKYTANFNPFVTGVVTIGLNYSAYIAEVYRAGIQGVPTGQWEASAILGLSARHTWVRVILPQAVWRVFAPLGNYAISMLKESALLATITVYELFGTALNLGAETYRYFEPILLSGAIYLLISYPSSIAVRMLERRFDR